MSPKFNSVAQDDCSKLQKLKASQIERWLRRLICLSTNMDAQNEALLEDVADDTDVAKDRCWLCRMMSSQIRIQEDSEAENQVGSQELLSEAGKACNHHENRQQHESRCHILMR